MGSILKRLRYDERKYMFHFYSSIYSSAVADPHSSRLPDPVPPAPPTLPLSPLYPSLITNLPHPIMAYRDFLFPPSTPLYTPASTILEYLQAYARKFDLREHIRFYTEVENTRFEVRETAEDPRTETAQGRTSRWTVITRDTNTDNRHNHSNIDTLILANGRVHLPHFPTSTVLRSSRDDPLPIPGLDQWLQAQRAMHTTYYRTPPPYYHGSTVLVVGNGPSARDIAAEIAPVTRVVWRSVRSRPRTTSETEESQGSTSSGPVVKEVSSKLTSPKVDGPSIRFCSPIASLGPPPLTTDNGKSHALDDSTPNVFLADGQSLTVDYIILGTGYEDSFPFLSEEILDRHGNSNVDIQTKTSGYTDHQDEKKPLSSFPFSLSPLLYHLLPSSHLLPLGSLFILGLPRRIVPFPLFEAQCRLLTATLQGHGQLSHIFQKQHLRSGHHPYSGGDDPGDATHGAQELSCRYHLLKPPGEQFDYRQLLIRLSIDATKAEETRIEEERMVPAWHRTVYERKAVLRDVWRELERRGMGEEVVRGVGEGANGEMEWKELIERLLREHIELRN